MGWFCRGRLLLRHCRGMWFVVNRGETRVLLSLRALTHPTPLISFAAGKRQYVSSLTNERSPAAAVSET
jgi:hypothetical protein